MKAAICAALVLAAFATTDAAYSQVNVLAARDCGVWVSARKAKTSVALEAHVLGILDGLSLGANRDFWKANGAPMLSRDAVFLWIDNYCLAHPLDASVEAVLALFKERSGWRP